MASTALVLRSAVFTLVVAAACGDGNTTASQLRGAVRGLGEAPELYSKPPCGDSAGWGQELYQDAMGSMCAPACPTIGVYPTPCPIPEGANTNLFTPQCTHIAASKDPLCLITCEGGCPREMVCSDSGFCVFPMKSCLSDHLVGTWQVNDAFGLKGITVQLTILPPTDGCDGVTAKMSYLNVKLEYSIIITPSTGGQLHIKYLNEKASPVYYHEGYYFPTQDLLMEDLNFKLGKPSPDTSGVLLYKKIA
mmetsp:Transcript_92248/g.231996  ORF Transcript_92248/g.231996 Transcript_92248/m.231996 type:complete len:249 (-) Transcript_92248:286-1032(-)